MKPKAQMVVIDTATARAAWDRLDLEDQNVVHRQASLLVAGMPGLTYDVALATLAAIGMKVGEHGHQAPA